MMERWMIPCLYLQSEKAVTGFGQRNLFDGGDVLELASWYGEHGADALVVFDFSSSDEEHEKAIAMIRRICEVSGIPVYAAGNIRRLEDVKKLVYAGCTKVLLNLSRKDNVDLLPEVSARFGKNKMLVCASDAQEVDENLEVIRKYAHGILTLDAYKEVLTLADGLPVLLHTDDTHTETLTDLLKAENAAGLSGGYVSSRETDLPAFKNDLQSQGIPVRIFESSIAWSDFKLNSDGLIPVVVQDDRTDEVLMVAYMNEEAFDHTIKSGKMTYFSRSRQEQWVKGLTSGHYQYVRSLTLDCDNDTILARVEQIGAACHTGSRTCFFQPLIDKGGKSANPLRVFQDVYDVIMDRKANPKEGSYTNYLFDKGIDKILKKVGEECTEIVIAAKNPDKDEIRYEIADYLYHLMVLMAEKGVTWEDVTSELARRE